ncbi:MAG: hypothetical protein EA412_12480 [Chitinophagaceae bacterium]|nr:MAG: hypothetical protein EA412_12480 [Chitinophagaceae bacterium]
MNSIILKKLNRSLLLLVLPISFIIFTSCSKDPCEDVVCENGGIETEDGDDCICECPAGFYGELCESSYQDDFVGTYSGNESCDSGEFQYSLSISASSSDPSLIRFHDLYQQGFTVEGIIDENGDVTIPEQALGIASISGSAGLSNGTLTVTYTVQGDQSSDSCSGNFEKNN